MLDRLSPERISTTPPQPSLSELDRENRYLRVYLQDALAHLRGSAKLLGLHDMPGSARNTLQFIANAERYLEEGL
jgi:hypothetical protein